MSTDFTGKLLEWNRESNNRPMPWKGETDPYRIWLSEIILQQTRVDQGWFFYERFITSFPTIHDLAAAPEASVFKLWEGLGYYNRCRNLIYTAKLISSGHDGVFPSTYEEILLLKGIGPYTAAAIASFAFNESRAVVDGNVQRVLARYFGISTPIDSVAGKIFFQSLAQTLIDKESPAIYNQAIMDFGATICKPKNPLCAQCIQAVDCEAFQHGFVNLLPLKRKKIKKSTRWLYYFLIEVGNSVYIRKREQKDIWQNLHEFVLMESEEPAVKQATDFLLQLFRGKKYELQATSKIYSQQLTHQRINGQFFVVKSEYEIKIEGDYILTDKNKVSELAFPKFINNYLSESQNIKPEIL